MSTFFTAKDANGVNIKIAADYDATTGIYYPSAGLPSHPIVAQNLSSDGNGGGTTNLIGNYSPVATDFWAQPPADEKWHLVSLNVFIESSSMRVGRYVPSSALSNGVEIIVEQNSVQTVLTDGGVTKLGQWSKYCGDVEFLSFGSGNVAFQGTWDFALQNGAAYELDGATNDKLIVRLNDDLSTLVEHMFVFHGHKYVS